MTTDGTHVNFRMVRLARETRGLTQSALARASAVPQARISRIETGQLSPASDELDRLAAAVEVPVGFLLEPGLPVAAPLFRRRAIRSVRTLAQIQGRINVAVLIAQRLVDAGVEIEPPQAFPEPGEFAPDQPAAAAAALRRAWRLPAGRLDDVTAVIESAAGIVLRVDFGSANVSAAFVSTATDGRMWFLVNTRETAGDRIRLSLAHELGHAVLHRMLASSDEGESERQAFRFAAALLLPPEDFDPVVGFDALTLRQARELKRTFGVSIQAVVRAAHDRGRIGRERYTSLFKQLSARQWRTVEPDPVPLEAPYLWPEILRVHRQDHGYGDAELAAIARVDVPMLADLFPESFTWRHRLRIVSSKPPA